MSALSEESKSKGFTLIEILIAIAIISIMGTVGVVSYSQSQKAGRIFKRNQDLNEISKAVELYKISTGTYPLQDTLNCIPSALEPTYVKVIPKDPLDGSCYKYISDLYGIDYKIRISSSEMTSTDYNQKAQLVDPTNSLAWAVYTPGAANFAPDTTQPTISSIASGSITSSSATISWTTDEDSDTRVDWGTTTSYGSNLSSSTLVTSHSSGITGLSAGTVYHYKVTSKDAALNSASSADNIFVVGKWVFVTSALYTGNLGGLAGADANCKTLADAAGPTLSGRTWMAWLSDDNNTPNLRFTKSTLPYVLVNGTQIAANWTALVAGISAPINVNELGQTVPPTQVWTDTLPSGWWYGTGPNYNCANWTVTGGSGNSAQVGLSSASNSQWTNSATNIACNSTLRLYCFEQ